MTDRIEGHEASQVRLESIGVVITTPHGFTVLDSVYSLVGKVKWHKGGKYDWHRTVVGLHALRMLAFQRGLSFVLRPYESVRPYDVGYEKWGWNRDTRGYGKDYSLIRVTNYGVWAQHPTEHSRLTLRITHHDDPALNA